MYPSWLTQGQRGDDIVVQEKPPDVVGEPQLAQSVKCGGERQDGKVAAQMHLCLPKVRRKWTNDCE